MFFFLKISFFLSIFFFPTIVFSANRLEGYISTGTNYYKGIIDLYWEFNDKSEKGVAYTFSDMFYTYDRYGLKQTYILSKISQINVIKHKFIKISSTNTINKEFINIKYNNEFVSLPIKINYVLLHTKDNRIIKYNKIKQITFYSKKRLKKEIKKISSIKENAYIKKVVTSSVYPTDAGGPYYPEMAMDDNSDTAWQAYGSLPKRIWYKIIFNKKVKIKAMDINGSIGNPKYYSTNPRISMIRLYTDDHLIGNYHLLDKNELQRIIFKEEYDCSIFKIEINNIYKPEKSNITQPAISEIKLYRLSEDKSLTEIPILLD